MSLVTIVIALLLLPTLFGKRGIFTRSPLLWVFETLSFLCYHAYLPYNHITVNLEIIHHSIYLVQIFLIEIEIHCQIHWRMSTLKEKHLLRIC